MRLTYEYMENPVIVLVLSGLVTERTEVHVLQEWVYPPEVVETCLYPEGGLGQLTWEALDNREQADLVGQAILESHSILQAHIEGPLPTVTYEAKEDGSLLFVITP